MANIIKQIENLYEQELYSNVIKVSELAVTISDQKTDLFTFSQKLILLAYYADSLYYEQQYLLAENLYRQYSRQAFQIRKNLMKNKNTNNNSTLNENQTYIYNDVEIKYKIYLCCIAQKQKKAAADILQQIAARSRTPKINMALGNLYKEIGMERSAITCFKEVLRECPMALEAVENLLKLGIKGVEVNCLVFEASSEIPWLGTWIKAQAQLHSKEFSNAIQTYRSLDIYGVLKDNTTLLVNLAYCHHYLYEDEKAISLLQKAIRLEPSINFGRDLLATLLANSGSKEHIRYLETILPTTDMISWTCEQWIVIGNFMYAKKNHDKALLYGERSLELNKRNIEGFLLKANSLLQLKMHHEAIKHCTEALQFCPFRYDLHKCLIECYIQTNRLREAESMAINACKQLNHTPQAYMLHASVLLKDPLCTSKTVRKVLEKAVSLDKNCLTNAIYTYVEFLEQEQQYEQAINLLFKHIETNPTSRMHQLLGDCLVNTRRDNEAFHHYTVALRMDPNNQRATEGLNAIGGGVGLNKKDSYYRTGETSHNSQAANASDQEADAESDSDMWATGNDTRNSFD